MSLVTRFAPTPSGFLHRGNAFNFLLTWLLARTHDGYIHLRIDDMDEDRVRPEYLEDIFRSMEWLGLTWDKGPFSVQDHQAAFRQRLRLDTYLEYLDQLRKAGELFACTCSRKDIREKSPDGSYPGTCKQRNRPFDAPETAWRIHSPWPHAVGWTTISGHSDQEALSPLLKDVILRKKDGWPAYQLISVAEDVAAGVTHVVRGKDLRASTACQLWLAEALGLYSFSKVLFHHHHLIRGEKGQKMSKSAGDISLKHQYEPGTSSKHLIRAFADWMGWQAFEGESSAELLQFASETHALDQLT